MSWWPPSPTTRPDVGCAPTSTTAGVELHALPHAGPTRRKTRIRAAGQTLLRLDDGGPGTPGDVDEAALRAVLFAADVVLVADYGAGTTAHPTVRSALTAVADRRPVVWDPHPKGAAPVPGCALVTPNLAEARRFADDPRTVDAPDHVETLAGRPAGALAGPRRLRDDRGRGGLAGHAGTGAGVRPRGPARHPGRPATRAGRETGSPPPRRTRWPPGPDRRTPCGGRPGARPPGSGPAARPPTTRDERRADAEELAPLPAEAHGLDDVRRPGGPGPLHRRHAGGHRRLLRRAARRSRDLPGRGAPTRRRAGGPAQLRRAR